MRTAEAPLGRAIPTASRHPETGLPLPGERYCSPEFAAREWDRMWTKAWLLLGREAEIPEPGDYQVEEVGPESILMIRQDDGSVRAFYNVCPHRGNRLVWDHWGSRDGFSCSYHNWRFDPDGMLAFAPDADNFIGGNPCGKVRLTEIACACFAGFVWVNMDPHCGSLRAYLGPIWDRWLAYPLADMRRYLALSARMPCNWKIAHDNFSESYHVQTVHPQAAWMVEDNYRYMPEITFPEGHCYAQPRGATIAARVRSTMPAPLAVQGGLADPLRAQMQHWGLDPEAFAGRESEIRAAVQHQKRALGAARGRDHYAQLSDDQLTDYCHFSIFPNISMTITSDGMHFLRARPLGTDPARSLFDNWFYAIPPSDPDEAVATPAGLVGRDDPVEHQLFDYGERSLGATVDQDTGIMAAQQQGYMSRGYKGGYLANEERRLLHYHDVIDEYIAGIRPR